MNTVKKNLYGTTGLFGMMGRMTPAERRVGRYMRAPDHDGAGGGGGEGDNNNPGDPPTTIDPTEYARLVAAHERLKKDSKADRDARKDLETRLAAIEKEKDDAEQEAANKSGDVEKVRRQLEDKHAVALQAEKDRADRAEAKVRKLVINTNLSKELDAVRIKPDLKKAATAMLLEEGIDLEEGDDDEPVAVKGGLPLAEAIKLWAESPEGKAFILEGNAGGGANGGGKSAGRNPWKRETWSLTEQDALEFKNPGQAARLKAEAGVT